MSTLRRQEPTGPGLKRIACAQVELAIRCLTRQAGQAAAAAQAIDTAQAALALIEPDLPRPIARRNRVLLTSLSAGLAELTGPAILNEQLAKRYKKMPSDAALASAIKTLRKRWVAHTPVGTTLKSKAGNFNPVIYRLVADMAELRGHCGDWPVENIDNALLPRGLRRTYTRARKLANDSAPTESIEPLTQTLTELVIMLGLLSKACPAMVKAHRKLLARATNQLKSIQRAQALDQALHAELGKSTAPTHSPSGSFNPSFTDPITSDLADALAETPAAFIRRMQTYWNHWHENGTRQS